MVNRGVFYYGKLPLHLNGILVNFNGTIKTSVMKYISFLFAFIFLANSLLAQRTLIAPAKQEKIFPQWVGGDRDFWGHGPRVTGTVRVEVTEGKGQIIAFINLRLEETEGDGSAAEVNETRLIYNAPAGKQIRSIITPGQLASEFNTKLARGGLNRVGPASRIGPASHLIVNGDGESKDIGNNTNDDSYVSVFFNGFVVELEPLPSEVREYNLAKSLLSSIVAAKLNGTKGRLNTYGPRVGDSWFKPNDSWLKFPDEIRRDTMFFTDMKEVLISPRRYNYNDINLRTIRGDVNQQYLRLSVNWESDGPEFRGECVNDVGCMFGSPSVQLDNFSIKINVRPFVKGNRLLYDPWDIQVDFGYNYSADCGILSALCTEIFKDPVQNAFFNARFMLASVLREAATLDQISVALTDGIMTFLRVPSRFPGATQIVEVMDRGNDISIRCR